MLKAEGQLQFLTLLQLLVSMASCKCKVGGCNFCSSPCRRCGCGCDGRDPNNLQQRRGRPTGSRKKTKAASNSVERSTGTTKRRLDVQQLSKACDLWKVFDLVDHDKSKMPSLTKRTSGNDINRYQWSMMVKVLSTVMKQTAELLFPADSPDPEF